MPFLKNLSAGVARRTLLAATLVAVGGAALAQGFPNRPIRVVVPFAPGGGTDIIARVVGEKLSHKLGQPLVVINTPGAGGTIGGASVARADPDGHTLLVWHVGMISSAHTNKPLQYDPLKSFTPIGQLSTAANLLAINPSLPAKNLKEFLALAKAKPGDLNYGSSGVGGADHLACELLSQVGGIDVMHVPYRGGGPATAAVVGGEVQFVCGSASQVMTMVKADRLRPLAVMQKERISSLPDVPTTTEAGLPQLQYQTWFGMWGPAGMAPEVVARISSGLKEVLADPEVKAQLEKGGVEPAFSTPQAFNAMFREDHTRWNKVLSGLIK